MAENHRPGTGDPSGETRPHPGYCIHRCHDVSHFICHAAGACCDQVNIPRAELKPFPAFEPYRIGDFKTMRWPSVRPQ